MTKISTICEIGCNHLGDLDYAFKMIDIAANFVNADIIKFQKRNNKLLLSEEEYNQPHPVPENSYGSTYGEHREYLEFSLSDHEKLKKYCEKFNKNYSCSIWDVQSAKEIISLEPLFLKIPSALNLNFVLLEYVLNNYNGDIHLSLGMTYENEIQEIYDFFKNKNRLSSLVLYYCKSTYPSEDKDLNLLQISKMKQKYPNIKGYGFSGHHKGISIDVAALTLGATYFERHFTLDRTQKGTDHAASLEPDGFRRLVRNLSEANSALTEWDGDVDTFEKIQRKKLKKIDKND